MKTVDDYLGLITGEHRDKPNFAAAVSAFTGAFMNCTNMLLGLPGGAFDLDQAVGAQLDILGLWIGVGRAVPQPLTGLYFSWEDNNLCWEKGYWQGPYDPSDGLVNVDDATYRVMLRAKIAANSWDGSLAGMYAAYALAFGPNAITLQDNFDMSFTVIYDSNSLNPILVALLTGGYFKLKPDGVRVTYIPQSNAPLMAWDRNLPKLQGWNGVAVWV